MASGCRRCGGPVYRGACLNCRPDNAVCPSCKGFGTRQDGGTCGRCRGRGDLPVSSTWSDLETTAQAKARLARVLATSPDRNQGGTHEGGDDGSRSR